jgi:hypothetical protein
VVFPWRFLIGGENRRAILGVRPLTYVAGHKPRISGVCYLSGAGAERHNLRAQIIDATSPCGLHVPGPPDHDLTVLR